MTASLLSSRPCRSSAITVLGVALLAGCTVGPDYHRPTPLGTNTLPASFSENQTAPAPPQWQTAQPAAHLPRGSWWEAFGDPELNRLETLTLTGNQTLVAASARFQQARALVNVARAGFFPDVRANPTSYTRQRNSLNQPENGAPAGVSPTFNNFVVGLEAGWEPDLWGRVRRQVEAARARLTASADDLEAVQLALQAEVATDYFAMRALDADVALLDRTVAAYHRSLELTRNRRAGGIASDLDVAQAESQLRATEAQLPAARLQRVRTQHALAVLCGQSPTAFAVAAPAAPVGAAPAPPLSLPSELLERRPDIAAAEHRMAAANAEVGVARTAFYPRLLLNGLAGFQSLDAATLFDWPSRMWAVGPSLNWPLFTGGRTRAQAAAAQAAYEETVAHYRQTVLVAFQEVEDNLAAQRLLDAQIQAEQAALVAANRTLEVANNRYRAGLVTYLEVAVSQNAALDRERTVVRLKAERLAAGVALIKALGGSWHRE
jgi:outer membrane protein, multidrug efflux system